ncbi:TIGR03758 family integrating conjugative element protein [Pseudomonas chlororaphis]|uniref:TIGR03758 family integrating conjugative element protein n=1 Tax=Pseudomonas chlororaphis TaxID=587753 RepID=UPI0019267002|nr:TIGR03758 family integrating conjugative element protein [Pseudomonas chlororaphis]QQX57587.1 TIGR03758 family integrating conjugative element protein [Pseudomonas chlororaphis subsp. aurantiaca]
MSMNGAQSSAFQAAAGFSPSVSYTLFVGVALAATFLWAAWSIYSCYRGWATGNLDRSIAATSVTRVLVLCMILMFFVLS